VIEQASTQRPQQYRTKPRRRLRKHHRRLGRRSRQLSQTSKKRDVGGSKEQGSVVLVHGTWADGSSWKDVIGRRALAACLVERHTWDTLGALSAGWEAAPIKRVGNDVLGVGPQPQIAGNDP
jgi:hypothetical protein